MADVLSGNAVIGQSGGPTAVINQSLVGVIQGLVSGLVASDHVGHVYGMKHGVSGLTDTHNGGLVDLAGLSTETLEQIARAPAAALGSTRHKPDEAYCERILEGCRQHNIRYFFYIGGNDSADTCRIVSEEAAAAGYEMRCFHVPKTIDNDLRENDHTPGFPSAARFVTLAFMGDSLDNASLGGIKINVIMGRHAGFLTAAAALARGKSRESGEAYRYDAAHLIYVPEVPFSTERFLRDVDQVYSRIGRCQIAVSEGICDEAGNPMGPQLAASLEHDAHGNVQLSGTGALGDELAELVKKELTPEGGKAPRVRADTFGYLQRCWPEPSLIDAAEARAVGHYAAALAAEGGSDASIVIRREDSGAYRSAVGHVELSKVARHTRHMPPELLGGESDVSLAFYDYCEPLIGEVPVLGRL